jgi:UDP:flavonoid glycosyltransferase YjiC (YdhE family)
MARIVITSWGSYGDLNPYLGLALALKARGHVPVLATAAYYRPLIEGEGIEFAAVRPDIDVTDVDLVRRAMDERTGSEVVIRELVAPAVDEAFEDLQRAAAGADLLVSHPATLAAPVLAQLTGIPWASTVLAPLSFFSIYDFPVLPPAPWLKSLEQLGFWPNRVLLAVARRMTAGWTDPVYQLRARLGLPRGEDPVYEGQHSPACVLGLFPRVLATPAPDWPRHTTVTGAIIHDVAHGRSLEPVLLEFLKGGDAPLVFTLGSAAVLVGDAFYEESVRAALSLGRRAVLLVGEARARALQPTLPHDILAIASAPHSLLFPRAAAVVHHCGIGTLSQSLVGGRPLLAVPFAHDQPDNAHRAARLGVARIIRASKYRARRVAHELQTLLDEPSYARNAAAVAGRTRGERGAATACDALESLLAGTQSSST